MRGKDFCNSTRINSSKCIKKKLWFRLEIGLRKGFQVSVKLIKQEIYPRLVAELG